MKNFMPALPVLRSIPVRYLLLAVLMAGGTEVSFSQVKVTRATCYKTVGGMSGVSMNYNIEFKGKKNNVSGDSRASLEIDSVKTIADASLLSFSFNKQEPCCNEITFTVPLLPPAKCKTCLETTPVQQDLTRGVTIYYRRNGKKYACKVKKIKRLPDVLQP